MRPTVERLANVLQRQQPADLARLGLGRHAAQPGTEDDGGDGILEHACPFVVVPYKEGHQHSCAKVVRDQARCSLVVRVLRCKRRQLADCLDLLLDAVLELAQQGCIYPAINQPLRR